MNEKPVTEMVPLDPQGTDNFHQLAIEGRDLIFQYGNINQRQILKGVNIQVNKGDIYGLLGPSGCGKTTLLKCIIGKLKAHSGTVRIYGRQPSDETLCIPGQGIGYMPQELALYRNVTVNEMLVYFGCLYFMKRKKLKERIQFLLNFLSIKHKYHLIKNLSGGEQRRVSFACALIHEPPLLILDEPTVGVDPLLRRSIWDHLKDMTMKQHKTILITTHYVEEARKADRVGLMRDGNILIEKNPETLIHIFSTKTLEDVFLKLCEKNDGETEKRRDVTINFENGAINSETERIWLTHEESQRKQFCVKDNIPNQETKLLFDKDFESNSEIIYPKVHVLLRFIQSLMRMTALMDKSFKCLRRNVVLLLVQLFVPFIQVIVFCLCTGQEPFGLTLAVVNNETSIFGFSQAFIDALSNETFNKVYYDSEEAAIHSIRNGESWAAMSIGNRFSSAAMDRFLEGNNVENQTITDSTIKLYLDMTNQQIGFTVYTKFIQSFISFGKQMLASVHENPYLSESPIALQEPVYGAKDPNFAQFLAPGIMLGMVHITAIGLSLLPIITEKREGLLDRCWVAGVSAVEMIIGIQLTQFFTMIGQVAIVLIATVYMFDVPILGSVFWVVLCILLAGASGMSYGLLISVLCDEEAVAVIIAVASFYPIFLSSGLLWPVESMNYYLQCFSNCLPLTLLGNTIRSLMLRGWSITQHGIWKGPLVATGWMLFLLAISVIMFKFKQSRT